jgi:hypothetical protein
MLLRCVVVGLVGLLACAPSTGGEGEEGEGEEGEGEEGEGEGENIDNPWGFTLRTPRERSIACEADAGCPQDGTLEFTDEDVVCTFTIDGRDDVVYLQATPTQQLATGSFVLLPIFEARAFLSSNNVVTELTGATYDYGGGHHNDFYRFNLDGEAFTYNHSSYGFGFRACQPVDCVQREGGDADIDGCRPARTLPEACITVGNPMPALTDTFARCNGDDS